MNTVVACVCFLWAAFALWSLPKSLRADLDARVFRVPRYWRWGDDAWYGLQRGNLISPFWIAAGGLIVVRPSAWTAVAWAATSLLLIAVFLVNRPRILVPPALRRQRGYVARWLP